MTTETTNNTEYASKGIAGTGLGLGIAGTALALLNGGGMLLGNNGFLNHQGTTQWVSKDEYAAGQQIAAKDAEIALLKSENSSEAKMIDVYKTLANKIEALNEKLNQDNEKILTRTDTQYATINDKIDARYAAMDNKVDANKNAQDGVNMMQVGFNARTGQDIECIKHRLGDIAKFSVPFYDVTKPAINPFNTGMLSSLY